MATQLVCTKTTEIIFHAQQDGRHRVRQQSKTWFSMNLHLKKKKNQTLVMRLIYSSSRNLHCAVADNVSHNAWTDATSQMAASVSASQPDCNSRSSVSHTTTKSGWYPEYLSRLLETLDCNNYKAVILLPFKMDREWKRCINTSTVWYSAFIKISCNTQKYGWTLKMLHSLK